MALGVAANTIGKVIASTVFMCVCSTFRPSDFLLFVKNGFVVGVRCQGNSESLKECEYPHCASATRRLALDNLYIIREESPIFAPQRLRF